MRKKVYINTVNIVNIVNTKYTFHDENKTAYQPYDSATEFLNNKRPHTLFKTFFLLRAKTTFSMAKIGRMFS